MITFGPLWKKNKAERKNCRTLEGERDCHCDCEKNQPTKATEEPNKISTRVGYSSANGLLMILSNSFSGPYREGWANKSPDLFEGLFGLFGGQLGFRVSPISLCWSCRPLSFIIFWEGEFVQWKDWWSQSIRTLTERLKRTPHTFAYFYLVVKVDTSISTRNMSLNSTV